ncbi:MAG: fumarylacetoacetate hydrolase family protein [Candidatus Dormibacteria bacterium]
MKLARYTVDGEVRLGEVAHGEVSDLVLGRGADSVDALIHFADRPAPVLGRHQLEAVRLLSPVLSPSKILCIGLNYRDHCRETGTAEPPEPVVFAKFPNAIIGPGDSISWCLAESNQVDWEVELAAVVGKRTRRVDTEDALDHIFGYTIANDVSARDVQFGAGGQWTRGKSFDSFLPLGPWIVTADEVPDPQSLGIRATVSGTLMQDSTTAEMIFGVAEIVSFLSQTMTLEPGDVIATGTPYGVGFTRTPPRFLHDGDTVRLEVDRIGTLENEVSTA